MAQKPPGQTTPSFAAQSSHTSHDNVAELKEAFFILDSSNSGSVSAAEIRNLFCSIIPNLTDAGFNHLLNECQVDATEPVTFAQFFVLLTTISAKSAFGELGSNPSASALNAAFAPFDPDDTGFVDSSVFLYLMGEKGERLSARELEDLRLRLERTGFMKRGRVNYKGFINNLLATTADRKYL